MSELQEEKKRYVYFVAGDHYAYTGYFKVGVTGDFKSRKQQIQSHSPFHILTVCVVEHSEPEVLEAAVLREFTHEHIRGEWFMVRSHETHQASCIFADAVKNFMFENCDGEVIYGG